MDTSTKEDLISARDAVNLARTNRNKADAMLQKRIAAVHVSAALLTQSGDITEDEIKSMIDYVQVLANKKNVEILDLLVDLVEIAENTQRLEHYTAKLKEAELAKDTIKARLHLQSMSQ